MTWDKPSHSKNKWFADTDFGRFLIEPSAIQHRTYTVRLNGKLWPIPGLTFKTAQEAKERVALEVRQSLRSALTYIGE